MTGQLTGHMSVGVTIKIASNGKKINSTFGSWQTLIPKLAIVVFGVHYEPLNSN